MVFYFFHHYLYLKSLYIYNKKNHLAFAKHEHPHNTGQVEDFVTSFCKLKMSSSAPSYMAPIIFNKLSCSAKEAINLNTSKSVFVKLYFICVIFTCFLTSIDLYMK